MSTIAFHVTLTPEDALRYIKQNHSASLIYDEYIDLNNEKGIGTLIYEKYYIRNSNRAALTVICDNVQGRTEVRAIATGASQNIFIKFDWGASDEFVNSISRILKDCKGAGRWADEVYPLTKKTLSKKKWFPL